MKGELGYIKHKLKGEFFNYGNYAFIKALDDFEEEQLYEYCKIIYDIILEISKELECDLETKLTPQVELEYLGRSATRNIDTENVIALIEDKTKSLKYMFNIYALEYRDLRKKSKEYEEKYNDINVVLND